MSQSYPLVEAIFELRWGEVSPGRFNFSKNDTDVFYQHFAIQAEKTGFSVVETPNDDAPQIPHLVKYRYRKQDNTWPCLQVGLGIFTVNQIQDGYNRRVFLEDIEVGVKAWLNSVGGNIETIKKNLTVSLRYQNAFYNNQNDSEIEKIENIFGIRINFPEKFSHNIDYLNSFDFRFGLNCTSPLKSTANISIQNAFIEGEPGVFVDTVVESKLNSILNDGEDVKTSISNWINDAYSFQKDTYNQLMVR